jgi:hypothetical protein
MSHSFEDRITEFCSKKLAFLCIGVDHVEDQHLERDYVNQIMTTHVPPPHFTAFRERVVNGDPKSNEKWNRPGIGLETASNAEMAYALIYYAPKDPNMNEKDKKYYESVLTYEPDKTLLSDDQKCDLEKILVDPSSVESQSLTVQRIIKDRNVTWAEVVGKELKQEHDSHVDHKDDVGIDSLGVERTYLMFCGREHLQSPKSFIDLLKEQPGYNDSWIQHVFPKLKAFRNYFGITVEELMQKRLDHIRTLRKRRGSRRNSQLHTSNSNGTLPQ